MSKTFTLQVNRRAPRPRSPRLRALGAGSASSSAVLSGQIPADIAQQISAAIAALTERIASAYLSKLHDDVAAGRITFEQGLKALQTVSIEAADLVITSGEDGGGNIEADGDITAGGDLDVSGAAVIGGNLQADGNISTDADLGVSGTAVIGGDLTARSNLRVSGAAVIGGNTTVGGFTGSTSFAPDLLGHGWRIDAPGHGELDSLSLRKYLEVPELRFNRVTVRTGVQWQTFGAGLIEEVIHPDGFAANRGIIKLKLEEGEYGAVAENDYCMGIFHNENPGETNASANSDQHNGNFTFAGFQTVYFKVAGICDETGDTENPDSRNQYFIYELRPIDTTEGKAWSGQHHPQPSMSFACYANPSKPDRQSCIYSTTDYTIMLTGMTGWTYDGSNIAYIRGRLDDFTIPAKRIENGQEVTYYKQLTGYGVAFGNAYMWGSIDQFDRPAFLVTQQIYQVALNVAPDTVLGNTNWREDYDWKQTPQTPTTATPYLYSYWLMTYSDGSEQTQGPVLSSYDNSLLTVQLDKDVVSAALSNWYDDTQATDTLQFALTARLKMGTADCDVMSATASSAITGFSYQVTAISGNTATFLVTISGFVPQQVSGLLAENAYVTFRLYSTATNYAEKSLAIVENRQGNDGDDGLDAVFYSMEADTREFSHTKGKKINLHTYKVDGSTKELCRLHYVLAEYDAAGALVKRSIASDVSGYLGWQPVPDAVTARSWAFMTAGEMGQFYQSLADSSVTKPDAVCELGFTLEEPAVSLVLSQDGTLTYPVDADRKPEATDMAVVATLYADNTSLALTELTVRQIYGDTQSGMQDAGEDPSTGQCDFETLSGTAVATLTQTFRISASGTYGGKTYTRSKDISFCAVTAGTSKEGDQGIQGCVIRLRGEFDEETCYVNESGKTSSQYRNIVRYIDIVQVRDANGNISWHQRTVIDDGYTKDANGHYPGVTNTTYWEQASSFQFIATELLLANNAHINFGQGNQLLLMAEDGKTIVGGLSGFDSENPSAYRLWLGAQRPADAPFSVTHEGALVAANINSQFQDVSYCTTSGGTDEDGFSGHEVLEHALSLANIRSGSGVLDADGNTMTVKPRVYNLLAVGTKIVLPASSSYIGTRVLLCNYSSSFSSASEATEVIQQGRKVFLGAGLWYTYQELPSGGTPIWGLKYTEVRVIDFWSGIVELVAVPVPNDASSCQWSVIHSNASCIKYEGKVIYSNKA